MANPSPLELRQEVKAAAQDFVRRPFDINTDYMDSNEPVYKRIGSAAFATYSHDYVQPSSYSDATKHCLKTDFVEHGFAVSSMLLAIASDLYKRDIDPKGTPAQLADALLADTSVHLALMNMPGDFNKEVEHVLGLDRGEPGKNTFYFEDAEPYARLRVDPDEWIEARRYAAENYHGEEDGLIPFSMRYCPMRGFVVGKVWPAMVTLAATHSDAFPRELTTPEELATT